MKETIKKAFLGGIVFLGTVITGFIGFAAWTDLPTQNNGDTLNSTIWNNLISTVNNIGKSQLGIDQTRQDVKASRTYGTTYTNNTGKPITVNVGVNYSAGGTIYATVNGILRMGNGRSVYNNAYISVIVPNNNTYSITCNATCTISTWTELR